MNTQNVDHAEVEKFQSIASRWWDTESEFKTLHDINPLRINYIEQQCGGLEGKKVLDIGCGGGILSEAMAAKGAIVTGIDMAELSLDVARMHLMESGLKVDYQQITAEEFCALHTQQFDIVTCMELLEHVPQALKPEGGMVLSTLNRNPKSYLLAIVGAEYIMKMLPKGTHDYNKFIKPSELARAVRDSGMEVQDVSGMSYHPITRQYSLSRDVDVNYLMSCRLR
jgi:2-polyprenyl-6-hydroxyphenyl methylase / 3-demethylubiquinone-9 3-methyltransferase